MKKVTFTCSLCGHRQDGSLPFPCDVLCAGCNRVLPTVAGPARLGVGATRFKSGAGWTRESAAAAKERAKERGWVDPDDSPDESSDDSSDDEGGKPLPWWILPAAAVAIGGGLAVAYEFGWIGKKR